MPQRQWLLQQLPKKRPAQSLMGLILNITTLPAQAGIVVFSGIIKHEHPTRTLDT
jgi:hypothetical protein